MFGVKNRKSKLCVSSSSQAINAIKHILMKFVKQNIENMENVAPNMPSLDFDLDDFSQITSEDAFTELAMDGTDEAFISEMYGPSDFKSSKQNSGSHMAEPSSSSSQSQSIETPSAGMQSNMSAESIEKMLMESIFLRKLAENQAALTESHAQLLQNQEKLLKTQENLASTLNEILNELLRSGECNSKAQCSTPKSNQKRSRLSNGYNDNDVNGITGPKKYKMDIPLNTNKTLYFNHSLTKICIICKKRYERIVNHYKQCHSLSEVVASRLSPKMANEIQKDHPKSSIVVKNINNLIEAECAFCEDFKTFTATYWPNHIQAHTGGIVVF